KQTAVKLRKGSLLIDIAVAQHIGAEDRAKSSIAKGQGVDGSSAHWPRTLSGGAGAGSAVGVKADRHVVGKFHSQPRQQRAGAATGVEPRPAASRQIRHA